ncbi:hypothetical protein WDV76_14695 [Xenorhabdus griffiniae]|uniref:hypothetical protein n=1 Tax=Xenorhabdus griffiniae TaxID=351672 RepID=UPI0030D13B21
MADTQSNQTRPKFTHQKASGNQKLSDIFPALTMLANSEHATSLLAGCSSLIAVSFQEVSHE